MLSVIIPSRSSGYLQKTIDELLAKAGGEIEIIIVLDGYWPDPPVREDSRVRIIHHGTIHDSVGMREGINRGVAISKGEYIMKIDEHCGVDQDFDVKLAADCEDNWVVIPRRHRWDPDRWQFTDDPRPCIDYMIIDYPFQRPYDSTCGLHGAEDRERYFSRIDVLIDDVMTMQGSCYFMTRKHWDKTIVRMEDENYGPFTGEAQEISMKTWLSGGRVVVNKKTWYAHAHKGSRGKGYGFSTAQYKKHSEWQERGRVFCINFWLNNKWEKRVHDFKWLVEKFWPIKGWPENWEEQIKIDREKDFSTLKYKDDFWLSNLAEKADKPVVDTSNHEK